METRFCSFCKARHPVGEFSPNQTQCRKSRVELQKVQAGKKVKLDPSYSKQCSRCRILFKGLEQVKNNFHKDRSRPDHFQPHCRECEKTPSSSRKIKHNYLAGKPLLFRKKLLSTILRIVKDESRSITRQLFEDFMHEGDSISFSGREWQIQILNDMSPIVVSRKPSQTGLTWLLERFTIALLMRYNNKPYKFKDHTGQERSRFIEAIYSFETKTKAGEWSKVRLEKVKQDNPHIQDALKIGKSDSTLLMQFGRTSLHLVGRATVSGVTTISADIVIVDEKDRDQNPDISSQIGSRTLESPFMNTEATKGLQRTVSTPEVSGAGISLLIDNSNYNEWEIDCVKCNTSQVLEYPECIGNFYESGEDPLRDENGDILVPFWRCMYCNDPIDWNTIGKWSPEDPDYYENARWVTKHPEKYDKKTGSGAVGYQVPFAGPSRPATFFLSDRDDPEHDIIYLHNHLLGLPYDDESKTLSESNFHRTVEIQQGFSGRGLYVMGCDHHPALGGFITIMKQKSGSITPTKPEGIWLLVHLEHVKNNSDLWDRYDDSVDDIKKGRLYELMLEYDIGLTVVDLEPDTNEVEKLISEFSFGMRVWGDKSGSFRETFTFIEDEMNDGLFVPVCKLYEDKVAAIDWYYNKIRFGNILFPSAECKFNHKMLKEFIDSHTNLYKGEIERKGFDRIAAENIREVYKKRVGKYQDHWVMSGKFAIQAIRLYFNSERRLKGFALPAIIGMNKIPGIQ